MTQATRITVTTHVQPMTEAEQGEVAAALARLVLIALSAREHGGSVPAAGPHPSMDAERGVPPGTAAVARQVLP